MRSIRSNSSALATESLRPGGILYVHIPMVTRVDVMMHLLRGIPLMSRVSRRWQEGRTSIFHLQIFTPEAIEIAFQKSRLFRIRDQSTQSSGLLRGTLSTLVYMRKARSTHRLRTSDHTFKCGRCSRPITSMPTGASSGSRKSEALQGHNPNSNDAFSFWKLPEEWKETLKSTIDPSTAVSLSLPVQRLPSHPEAGVRFC